MCYVHSSADMTLSGYVGATDKLVDWSINIYTDSDLAGDRPGLKVQAVILLPWKGRTRFPVCL